MQLPFSTVLVFLPQILGFITFNKISSKSQFSKILNAVREIGSTTELDSIIATSGTSLIIVDYSTTWCGPCKLVLPKFVELSEKYADQIFLKCIGDASKDATLLMKREGIRSVPAFHVWKSGKRVSTGFLLKSLC